MADDDDGDAPVSPAAYRAASEEVHRLREEIELLHALAQEDARELKGAKDALELARGEASLLQRRLEAEQSETSRLRTDVVRLSQASMDSEVARRQLREATADQGDLREERDLLAAQAERDLATIRALQTQLDEAAHGRDIATRKLGELEAEHGDATAEVELLTTHASELRKGNEQLAAQVNALEVKLAELEGEELAQWFQRRGQKDAALAAEVRARHEAEGYHQLPGATHAQAHAHSHAHVHTHAAASATGPLGRVTSPSATHRPHHRSAAGATSATSSPHHSAAGNAAGGHATSAVLSPAASSSSGAASTPSAMRGGRRDSQGNIPSHPRPGSVHMAPGHTHLGYDDVTDRVLSKDARMDDEYDDDFRARVASRGGRGGAGGREEFNSTGGSDMGRPLSPVLSPSDSASASPAGSPAQGGRPPLAGQHHHPHGGGATAAASAQHQQYQPSFRTVRTLRQNRGADGASATAGDGAGPQHDDSVDESHHRQPTVVDSYVPPRRLEEDPEFRRPKTSPLELQAIYGEKGGQDGERLYLVKFVGVEAEQWTMAGNVDEGSEALRRWRQSKQRDRRHPNNSDSGVGEGVAGQTRLSASASAAGHVA